VRGGSAIHLSGLGFRQGTTPLTVSNVYGGGAGYSTAALTASSEVYGGTYIKVGGNTITANVVTVGSIYGGGSGACSTVYGGTMIEFAGNFTGINANKLVITGSVRGGGRNGAVVEGDRKLMFNDFQGTLTADFADFDRLAADGYTQANFSGETDFGEVTAIDFDFSKNEPLSEETAVFSFANAVNFAEGAKFTLEFEARSAVEGAFTLIECEEAMSLDGMEYTITDSLYGNSFSAALGDGSVWEYYGNRISLETTSNRLTLQCTAIA